MDEKINPEERIDAVWCRDSETGDYVLIDTITNKILMRRPCA